MRLLYSLCGEGNGHATRTMVVLEHLRRRGHDILVAAPGSVYSRIRAVHDRVVEIVGLRMRCEGGAMDLGGTVDLNLLALPEMVSRNGAAWSAAETFRPEAAITDYDSFAWLFGRSRDLPVVSIDNAQILPRCDHDPRILARDPAGFDALSRFTRAIAPDCHYYVVTTFFTPPVRAACVERTTLVPPILRRSVIDALPRVRAGDHVLVYKTPSLSDDVVLGALAEVDVPFVLYGFSGAWSPEPGVRWTFRSYDEDTFVRDLATCRAVIGSGGMSLLGEAITLGKPVLAVPIRGQYEQVLNACYLELLGYGLYRERLSPGVVEELLAFRPRGSFPCDRNARLYQALDVLFGEGERATLGA